ANAWVGSFCKNQIRRVNPIAARKQGHIRVGNPPQTRLENVRLCDVSCVPVRARPPELETACLDANRHPTTRWQDCENTACYETTGILPPNGSGGQRFSDPRQIRVTAIDQHRVNGNISAPSNRQCSTHLHDPELPRSPVEERDRRSASGPQFPTGPRTRE